MKKYKAEDILEAREKRVGLQDLLMRKHELPLMVIRANYPGLNKNNELTNNIVNNIGSLLNDILTYKVICSTLIYGAEGPVLLLSVKERPNRLKDLAIDIEEKHTLGRCVDIDIFTTDGKSISRRDRGIPMRKCYLCNDTAHNCVRSKRHSEAEVINYINETYKEFMENFYEKQA